MDKTLVAYFSATGTTAGVAKNWPKQQVQPCMKLNHRNFIPQQT